jgi:hypothetical protein
MQGNVSNQAHQRIHDMLPGGWFASVYAASTLKRRRFYRQPSGCHWSSVMLHGLHEATEKVACRCIRLRHLRHRCVAFYR